jgi:hypothetical protein
VDRIADPSRLIQARVSTPSERTTLRDGFDGDNCRSCPPTFLDSGIAETFVQ